jgi:hypothetical protein
MRPTGVLICIPAYEHKMYAETALSLFCAAQFFAEKKIHCKFTWYSGADIEDVRNLFLTNWYDTQQEFSHLLFVDADMGFEPELLRDFIRFDKPLMGVLYAKRKAGPEIVGIVPEGHSINDVVHGFIRADAVGCGVMMISRDVVTKMLEVMPYLSDEMQSSLMQATPGIKLKRVIRAFDKIRTETMRLSEDMSFCYRWNACGGEVWANVNHKISHVGPFDFAIRYGGVLAAKAQPQEQAA